MDVGSEVVRLVGVAVQHDAQGASVLQLGQEVVAWRGRQAHKQGKVLSGAGKRRSSQGQGQGCRSLVLPHQQRLPPNNGLSLRPSTGH